MRCWVWGARVSYVLLFCWVQSLPRHRPVRYNKFHTKSHPSTWGPTDISDFEEIGMGICEMKLKWWLSNCPSFFAFCNSASWAACSVSPDACLWDNLSEKHSINLGHVSPSEQKSGWTLSTQENRRKICVQENWKLEEWRRKIKGCAIQRGLVQLWFRLRQSFSRNNIMSDILAQNVGWFTSSTLLCYVSLLSGWLTQIPNEQ